MCGAEPFLMKKSLYPHAFLGQIWSEDEIMWEWTILITKSWGTWRFQEENVLGVAFLRENVPGMHVFTFFLFSFALCTPIQLSMIQILVFFCILCNMNMLYQSILQPWLH